MDKQHLPFTSDYPTQCTDMPTFLDRNGSWTRSQSTSGFTLLELIVSVVIMAILTSLGLPSYMQYLEQAKATAVASELRSFAVGVESYVILEGAYPDDSHDAIPPGTEDFIDATAFLRPTRLGGRYNWEGPNNYPYAGISIFNSSQPQHVFEQLDDILDDGNLQTGQFRLGTSGRPTYILDE